MRGGSKGSEREGGEKKVGEGGGGMWFSLCPLFQGIKKKRGVFLVDAGCPCGVHLKNRGGDNRNKEMCLTVVHIIFTQTHSRDANIGVVPIRCVVHSKGKREERNS